MEMAATVIHGKRARILVVDPSRTRAGLIARRLAEAGYRVSACESGSSAIPELYRLPIDLVLAELDMSPMTGAELTRAIRGEVQWNDVPVMLISSKSQAKGTVLAYEAGADDVIIKPFHFDVLFARIDRRIAQARSVKRLRHDNAALDARIVQRAIQIGELRSQLQEERARGSHAL